MPRLEEDAMIGPSARLSVLLAADGQFVADRPVAGGTQDTARLQADEESSTADGHFATTPAPAAAHPRVEEEQLIIDDRSTITPAQMVEDKLTRILKDSSLPVSHLQTRRLLRAR